MICGLINPYGFDNYLHVYNTTFGSYKDIVKYIAEWQSVLSPFAKAWVTVSFLPIVFLCCGLSFFVNRMNFRLSHVFSLFAVFVLTWKAARFAPHLATIAVYIVTYNLGHLNLKVNSFFPYAALVAIIVYILHFHYIYIGAIFPLTSAKMTAPTATVDFLEENNIHGHAFHDWPLGAYLSFRRWPGERILIDGRNHIYGKELFFNHLNIFSPIKSSVDFFKGVEKQYDTDYAILLNRNLSGAPYLVKFFLESPEWKLVFYDPEEGVVFLKDVPKFKELIKKYGYKEIPDGLRSFLLLQEETPTNK
jgi:hypothetical protein